MTGSCWKSSSWGLRDKRDGYGGGTKNARSPLGGRLHLLQTVVHAALVARSRIHFNNAPLGGAVNQRKSLRQQCLGSFNVLAVHRAPHGTDLMAQARTALLIHRGAAFDFASVF